MLQVAYLLLSSLRAFTARKGHDSTAVPGGPSSEPQGLRATARLYQGTLTSKYINTGPILRLRVGTT